MYFGLLLLRSEQRGTISDAALGERLSVIRYDKRLKVSTSLTQALAAYFTSQRPCPINIR
jgi:hypothetical protein